MTHKAARRPSLADSVYEILRCQFIDGTRAAGEALNIATLSRELDVSQTPIREALARLESTGLVQREALKGYHAAPLFSEDDLVALGEARVILEPPLAYAAAGRVTGEFLEALRATIRTLDEASQFVGDARSFPRYWAADEQFHMAIAVASGNAFLARSYVALGGQVQRFRLFAERGSSDAGYAAEEHRRIYGALKTGDRALAADYMRKHVVNAGVRALRDRRDLPRLRSAEVRDPGSAS